jgi:uncharacterized membrane protein YfcA
MMTDAAAQRPLIPLLLIGATAGVMSGMFGIGGGVVMVPAMVTLAAIPQRRAHATSLAAIAPVAGVGTLVFSGASSVNYPAAAVLIVASVIGVQVGTRMMGRISEERLRQFFGVFMVVVALALFVR